MIHRKANKEDTHLFILKKSRPNGLLKTQTLAMYA